jgi:hypothetical protein
MCNGDPRDAWWRALGERREEDDEMAVRSRASDVFKLCIVALNHQDFGVEKIVVVSVEIRRREGKYSKLQSTTNDEYHVHMNVTKPRREVMVREKSVSIVIYL